MSVNFNASDCTVINFNGVIFDGIDQDGDEPVRINPVNEQDEYTISGSCVSINVQDDSAYIVEVDFANCSNTLSAIRDLKSQRLSDAYMSVSNVCNGESMFTTCAVILSNVPRSFGKNPGVKTVQFLVVNPEFTSATFQTA